jgi:diguanylate cyclase (GGDEF)-like protein
MGGDEFMILFPNAEIRESDNLLRRLKGQLMGRDLHGVPIDFSYGFSRFDSDHEISVEELIRKADSRMYEAKLAKKYEKEVQP